MRKSGRQEKKIFRFCFPDFLMQCLKADLKIMLYKIITLRPGGVVM